MKISILMAMMAVSFAGSAKAAGFGTDNLFDNLTASPKLIAREACPDFRITAGEMLKVNAQEEFFSIEDIDGDFLISIQVPSEGNYVFEGQGPSRTANQIKSQVKGVQASMNPETADITIVKLGSADPACVLTRCPGFGACN